MTKSHDHEDICRQLGKLEAKVEDTAERVKDKVSISRFSPVEKVVYGLVGIILIFVIQYILTNVIK